MGLVAGAAAAVKHTKSMLLDHLKQTVEQHEEKRSVWRGASTPFVHTGERGYGILKEARLLDDTLIVEFEEATGFSLDSRTGQLFTIPHNELMGLSLESIIFIVGHLTGEPAVRA